MHTLSVCLDQRLKVYRNFHSSSWFLLCALWSSFHIGYSCVYGEQFWIRHIWWGMQNQYFYSNQIGRLDLMGFHEFETMIRGNFFRIAIEFSWKSRMQDGFSSLGWRLRGVSFEEWEAHQTNGCCIGWKECTAKHSKGENSFQMNTNGCCIGWIECTTKAFYSLVHS